VRIFCITFAPDRSSIADIAYAHATDAEEVFALLKSQFPETYESMRITSIVECREMEPDVETAG
jgi:hypothetical protein